MKLDWLSKLIPDKRPLEATTDRGTNATESAPGMEGSATGSATQGGGEGPKVIPLSNNNAGNSAQLGPVSDPSLV